MSRRLLGGSLILAVGATDASHSHCAICEILLGGRRVSIAQDLKQQAYSREHFSMRTCTCCDDLLVAQLAQYYLE